MVKINTSEINNKANSQQLINFLETAISDEMILSSFIRDLSILKISEKVVIVGLQNDFAKDYIEKEYQNIFDQAVKEVLLNDKLKAKLVNKNTFVDVEHLSEKKNVNSNLNTKYSFDKYVVAKFNEKASQAAKAVVETPGMFSPLFIYSASGLGKTHLLHAMGNKASQLNKNTIYINPDKFTSNVTEAVKKSNAAVDELVKKYLSFDFLLFDDIQNLGDRTVTLKVLFNIINECFDNDKQVVFASDKTPSELGGFEDRFITRFEKGLTLEIEKPEIEDLILVLKRKLDDKKLSSEQWETEALKFIARNYSTSIRSIEGAVTRVKFFTQDRKAIKYTFSIITNIFQQLSIHKEELTPQRIINVVSTYYKVPKSDIYGKSRKKDVVIARHMAMWFIRTINNFPFQKIGEIFGNRDHSTVMSGVSKIDVSMKINTAVKMAVKTIGNKIKKVS